MKGVILAGGTGSRLHPLTKVTNKHLLPVYDKPMIFYAIEAMVKAGIGEVLLVAGGNNAGDFIRLLGSGREFGLRELNYTYQQNAGGIADALALAEHFAEREPILLILGDNILEYSIADHCRQFNQRSEGAMLFLTSVDRPWAYGIADCDADGRVVRIVEKPTAPATNLAVIGVYLYDQHVFQVIKNLKPSGRGELEITDVNNAYIERGGLTAATVEGYWVDAGESIDGYLHACNLVARHGANKDRQP